MTESPSAETLHSEKVPNSSEFSSQRREWRDGMALDGRLRRQAVDLQVAADEHHFTYQWEWLGVPVIRLPDDILVLQELIWDYRPSRIVETGVARGGSLVLNASLQVLCTSDNLVDRVLPFGPVEDEHPVEVVDFVLEHTRLVSGCLDHEV